MYNFALLMAVGGYNVNPLFFKNNKTMGYLCNSMFHQIAIVITVIQTLYAFYNIEQGSA